MENANQVEAGPPSFDELRQQWSQRTQEVRAAVSSFVEERPLAAVGIAFGAGYLLSGALFSRLTARVVGAGSKLLLGNVVRLAVASLGPGMLLDALGLHPQGQGEAHSAPRRGAAPMGNPQSSQH